MCEQLNIYTLSISLFFFSQSIYLNILIYNDIYKNANTLRFYMFFFLYSLMNIFIIFYDIFEFF